MLRRLLVLLVLVGLPALAQAQDFIRATPSSYTFLPDGTLANPSLVFASLPTSGFYAAGSIWRFGAGGTAIFTFQSAGIIPTVNAASVLGTSALGWKSVSVSEVAIGSKSISLTDAAAATSFVRVAVPTNGWAAGELIWTATSVSGADQLVTTGSVRFAGADTAGTPVCTISPILSGVSGTEVQSLSAVSGGANTLVCTWSSAVSTTNCALSVTCTNNAGGTQAITLYGRLDMPIGNTLAFP